MSDTLTRIPVGSRVLYIGGGEENNADLIGKFGTVRQDDNTITLPYYVEFDGSSYNRWWCPPEALVVVPKVGDKVIPVNGDRVGISAPYLNAVGTVSEVEYMPGSPSKCVVRAEFQSHQKPDDTVEWSMNEWKPADGHTLTVSDPYRPAVGDKVTITGYLSNEGIIDTIAHDGYIRAVDGDIWTIDSPLYGRQVSGPGYIALVLAASEDTSSDAPVLPHEEPRIITELREEAATLKRELDRANERVEEFRTRASKWERDFMRYAERILQEAVDRDWCSQYEEVMDDIRGNLEIASIPDREVEVDIEWEETYTVTVRRSGTVTLQAGYGEYEIEQAARDLNGNSDADRSEVLDAVRNGNYESCDFVDDSAQEA